MCSAFNIYIKIYIYILIINNIINVHLSLDKWLLILSTLTTWIILVQLNTRPFS